MLLLALAALMLWAASGVKWAEQRYRTPFTGETTVEAAGAAFRPELVPLALAALAAIAAVLATGGWFRRVIGGVVVLAGGFLLWRGIGWSASGPPVSVPSQVPSGSAPISDVSASVTGPILMCVGALVLACAGGVVLLRAHRMPAMGSKYSAPGARRKSPDPDKRLWDALDEGKDPTRDG